jgi:outer membrane immunogenic protein
MEGVGWRGFSADIDTLGVQLNKIAWASAIALLALPTATYAADLIVETPLAPEVEAAAVDWSGAYIGVHGGAGWGELAPEGNITEDLDGWLAGVQAGYNAQFGNFVLGIEGDVSWSNLNWEESAPPFFESTYTLDWQATLRARAGVAFDSVLLYGTAGLAAGGASYDAFIFPVVDQVVSRTHVGWVAGVGVEAMVVEGVSVKAEYLYRDLGSATYAFDSFVPFEQALTASTVTVGVNFHF